MRRPFVCANWKMNGTELEATALVRSLIPLLAVSMPQTEIALAPPFTSLRTVGEAIRGSNLALAAQNLHSSPHGAFTGEISAGMLSDLGVRYVLVGHSERRHIFRETDDEVGRKAAAAEASGLIPILCVGEDESERRDGNTLAVIEAQFLAGTGRLRSISGPSLVVAYEPVWAIGTGRTASTEQAAEVHAAIREILGRSAGAGAAESIRIIYGGSVTAQTAPRLLGSAGIDGALVGGASLVAASFASIVAAARSFLASG